MFLRLGLPHQYIACGFKYGWFYCKARQNWEVDSGSYLPACEAWSAQEVPTWLDANVLISLGANLTKLEGAADVAVELVLLLIR